MQGAGNRERKLSVMRCDGAAYEKKTWLPSELTMHTLASFESSVDGPVPTISQSSASTSVSSKLEPVGSGRRTGGGRRAAPPVPRHSDSCVRKRSSSWHVRASVARCGTSQTRSESAPVFASASAVSF